MTWESPVQHPLIDRIRACSSTPNDAADFFTHLLHPTPKLRLTTVEALHHPYMISCFKHMQCDNQAPGCPPVSLEEEAPAAQHRSVLRAIGNQMRVPHGVKLVRKVAGIVAKPVIKPFSCIRQPTQSDSVPDLSVYFPRYTHHSQDSQVMASVALLESMKSGIRVYGGSRVTAEGVTEHLIHCYPMPSPLLQTGQTVHQALPQLCPPESQANAQPAALATSSVVIEEVEPAEPEPPAASSHHKLDSHPIDTTDEEEDWEESEPPAASSHQKLDSHPTDTSDDEDDWEDSEAASSITSASSSDSSFVSAATHFKRVTPSDVTAALASTTADDSVSAPDSSGTTGASRCELLAVVLVEQFAVSGCVVGDVALLSFCTR